MLKIILTPRFDRSRPSAFYLNSVAWVKDLLSSCGGDEYLPLFAKKQISMKELLFMEEKNLKEVKFTSIYLNLPS